jgi:ketosteroid isomerase-like protein
MGVDPQHVLRAQLKNGRELALPACIICVVKHGRITRLDEYVDSAPLSALRSALW